MNHKPPCYYYYGPFPIRLTNYYCGTLKAPAASPVNQHRLATEVVTVRRRRWMAAAAAVGAVLPSQRWMWMMSRVFAAASSLFCGSAIVELELTVIV